LGSVCSTNYLGQVSSLKARKFQELRQLTQLRTNSDLIDNRSNCLCAHCLAGSKLKNSKLKVDKIDIKNNLRARINMRDSMATAVFETIKSSKEKEFYKYKQFIESDSKNLHNSFKQFKQHCSTETEINPTLRKSLESARHHKLHESVGQFHAK